MYLLHCYQVKSVPTWRRTAVEQRCFPQFAKFFSVVDSVEVDRIRIIEESNYDLEFMSKVVKVWTDVIKPSQVSASR